MTRPCSLRIVPQNRAPPFSSSPPIHRETAILANSVRFIDENLAVNLSMPVSRVSSAFPSRLVPPTSTTNRDRNERSPLLQTLHLLRTCTLFVYLVGTCRNFLLVLIERSSPTRSPTFPLLSSPRVVNTARHTSIGPFPPDRIARSIDPFDPPSEKEEKKRSTHTIRQFHSDPVRSVASRSPRCLPPSATGTSARRSSSYRHAVARRWIPVESTACVSSLASRCVHAFAEGRHSSDQ